MTFTFDKNECKLNRMKLVCILVRTYHPVSERWNVCEDDVSIFYCDTFSLNTLIAALFGKSPR